MFIYRTLMKKILSLCTFLSLFVVSCNPVQDAAVLDPRYFVAENKTVDMTMEEIFESFGAEDYPEITSKIELFAASEKFRAVVITYKTVDPLGNSVVADGTIYYPLDCKIKGVVEMSGIAHMNKDGGSSEEIPVMEGIPVLFGYAVFVPDMIGYGKYGNTKEMPHPFMMTENLGRVTYDFRKAAAEYMLTLGYTVPRRTIISGYSYGGGVALAVAKYYQEHHTDEIKVERVVAGGGAYDMNETFEGFALHPVCTYPLLPGIILSLNHYYKLELDYHQIFRGELADHCEEWYDRTRNASGLVALIGEDMRNYMHPDFFKPIEERNAEFRKLQPVLDMNSAVDGWTPRMPVYLYHSTEDMYVPIESAVYAAREFSERGAYVILKCGEGTHADWGVRTFADLLVYLILR